MSDSSPSARPIAPEVLRTFPGAPATPITAAMFADVRHARVIDAPFVDGLVGWLVESLAAGAAVGHERILTGLSGGIDSLLCARLTQMAVGGARALTATVLVGDAAERARLARLHRVGEALGVTHIEVDGQPLEDLLRVTWPERSEWTPINTETRVIQTLLFQIADTRRAAVCATRNRSERLLGRYTEAFYGHIAPLAGLSKTEVRALAAFVGVLDLLEHDRPGCAGHWYDDEIFGVGYDVLDPLLHLMAHEGAHAEDIAARFGIADVAWLKRLERRVTVQPMRVTGVAFGEYP